MISQSLLSLRVVLSIGNSFCFVVVVIFVISIVTTTIITIQLANININITPASSPFTPPPSLNYRKSGLIWRSISYFPHSPLLQIKHTWLIRSPIPYPYNPTITLPPLPSLPHSQTHTHVKHQQNTLSWSPEWKKRDEYLALDSAAPWGTYRRRRKRQEKKGKERDTSGDTCAGVDCGKRERGVLG